MFTRDCLGRGEFPPRSQLSPGPYFQELQYWLCWTRLEAEQPPLIPDVSSCVPESTEGTDFSLFFMTTGIYSLAAATSAAARELLRSQVLLLVCRRPFVPPCFAPTPQSERFAVRNPPQGEESNCNKAGKSTGTCCQHGEVAGGERAGRRPTEQAPRWGKELVALGTAGVVFHFRKRINSP